MRLGNVIAYIFSVPVDFEIAWWDVKFSHHCVVVLQIGGIEGYGSGVLYKNRPLQAVSLLRREVVPFLKTAAFDTLADLREQVRSAFVLRVPSVVYALDSALWDIEAKLADKPVNELLGIPQRDHIQITEQLFISDLCKAMSSAQEILGHGTKHIKIKIGRDPASDVDRVRKVRELAGDKVALGVDINGGYTLEQALHVGVQLRELGVRVLEDPLLPQAWEQIPVLREQVGIPVMQDAGICSASDLRQAIRLNAADYLNLKLTRIGGMTGALELAEICRQHGVGLSVGCSEDLGIGMASILHLASVFDQLYSTEGVGPERLGFDIIDQPWDLQDGCLQVPQGVGLGVQFNDRKLAKVARDKHFIIGDVYKPSLAFVIRCEYNKWYQRWFTLRCRLQRRIHRMQISS